MLRSWTIGRDHNNWNNKAHSFWLKLRAEGENKKLFSELYFVSRPKLLTRASGAAAPAAAAPARDMVEMQAAYHIYTQ